MCTQKTKFYIPTMPALPTAFTRLWFQPAHNFKNPPDLTFWLASFNKDLIHTTSQGVHNTSRRVTRVLKRIGYSTIHSQDWAELDDLPVTDSNTFVKHSCQIFQMFQEFPTQGVIGSNLPGGAPCTAAAYTKRQSSFSTQLDCHYLLI